MTRALSVLVGVLVAVLFMAVAFAWFRLSEACRTPLYLDFANLLAVTVKYLTRKLSELTEHAQHAQKYLEITKARLFDVLAIASFRSRFLCRKLQGTLVSLLDAGLTATPLDGGLVVMSALVVLGLALILYRMEVTPF